MGNHDVGVDGRGGGQPAVHRHRAAHHPSAYNNLEALEDQPRAGLALFAESEYKDCDVHHFYPHVDESRGPLPPGNWPGGPHAQGDHPADAQLECRVIDRNPDLSWRDATFCAVLTTGRARCWWRASVTPL